MTTTRLSPNKRTMIAWLRVLGPLTVFLVIAGSYALPLRWTAANPLADPGTFYAERLTEGHDCWTSGRHDLPNAAVITRTADVAPTYTTDPVAVDHAFNEAVFPETHDYPEIESVQYLCLD